MAEIDREQLGKLVRQTWVQWASEQRRPKRGWLVGWDNLDAGQREIDMRIGEAVANHMLARVMGDLRLTSLPASWLYLHHQGAIDQTDKSKIEWTQASWNPSVGCEHVSPGCDNCYAARDASGRLAHLPQYAGLASGETFTGEVRLLPERLDQPTRWRKSRRIFVNSMSDLSGGVAILNRASPRGELL